MRAIRESVSSQDVRRAAKLRRHVLRMRRAQRDLLPPDAQDEFTQRIDELRRELRRPSSTAALRAAEEGLSRANARWLVDTSRDKLRELTEMVLIGVVLVTSVRCFFVQPTQIPTGSMQPTLNGVQVVNLVGNNEWRRPESWLNRAFERAVLGRGYYYVKAHASGRITRIDPPEPILPFAPGMPFGLKQRFVLGDKWHTVWFVPRDLPPVQGAVRERLLFTHARVDLRRRYSKGEDVINLVVLSGDRLLVDRISYNFRQPRRGEIVVFGARDIPMLTRDAYYLKRLVALGGERLRIGNDRHLVVNGRRLDAQTPGFDRVYSFTGPPREDRYSGHVNDFLARQHHNAPGVVAPRFPTEQAELYVRPGHYAVMGDNTLMSLDSRVWGDISRTNVIGRAWRRYWPVR